MPDSLPVEAPELSAVRGYNTAISSSLSQKKVTFTQTFQRRVRPPEPGIGRPELHVNSGAYLRLVGERDLDLAASDVEGLYDRDVAPFRTRPRRSGRSADGSQTVTYAGLDPSLGGRRMVVRLGFPSRSRSAGGP